MANLLLLIKRNKIWVALGILMTILSNLSQMTFVYLIGKLVNHIESRSSISLSFILLIALLMASNALTLFLKQYIGRLSTEKMAHSLRMGYAKRLIKKTVKEKTSASLAMSVAQNELAQANNYLSNTLFDIAGMLIMAVLVTVYLLLQNVLLTLVIIVPTLFILVYVSFSSRRLSAIVSLAQNEKNKMNKVAYSLIHAFPSVKIFSGEKLCLNAYNESFNVWKKQWKKMGRLSALYNTLSGVLSRIPLLLLLLIGGFMVIRGDILMGTLIVFVIMQGSLSESIMNLPNWIANFKVFTTNLSRIDIE